MAGFTDKKDAATAKSDVDTGKAPDRGPVVPEDRAEAKRAAAEDQWRQRLETEGIDEEGEAEERLQAMFGEDEGDDARGGQGEESEEDFDDGEGEDYAEDEGQQAQGDSEEEGEAEDYTDADIVNAKRALGRLGVPKKRIEQLAKDDLAGLMEWAEESRNVSATHDATYEELQQLKSGQKAPSQEQPKQVEQSQPAAPSLSQLDATPLQEALGLDEQGSKAVTAFLAQAVAAATAPLQAKLDTMQEADVGKGESAIEDARVSLATQFPDLAYDDAFEPVAEMMESLSNTSRFKGKGPSVVPELMEAAARAAGLRSVKAKKAAAKNGAANRARQRQAQPGTSRRTASARPLSKSQRDRAAFDALGGGGDVRDAAKAYRRGLSL